MRQWYIIRILTGQEDKVKELIEKEAKLRGLEQYIDEIYIPEKKVTKPGKSGVEVRRKKLYPGYILIKMEPIDELFKLISEIRGVASFAGKGRVPQPLREEEVRIMFGLAQKKEAKEVELPFSKGESVRIVDGPFADFTGVIDEIFPDRDRVRVLVTVFGRQTPVELAFYQVEPIY